MGRVVIAGSFRCFSKLSREGGHLEGVSEGVA